MFSSEFGKKLKKHNEPEVGKKDKLAAFLAKHYVFCQAY
jgi:hypothetical protein